VGWKARKVFKFDKRMFGIEHSGLNISWLKILELSILESNAAKAAVFWASGFLRRWFGGQLCDDDRR
jgi:hypothetical protein